MGDKALENVLSMTLASIAGGAEQRMPGETSYSFEAFTLDLRRGSLRAGDREIDLRPKSFEVLRYLVENAGRLVPKDELIQAIWPDVTVTDESLTRCVSDVRLALQARAQRIIKTVPRRGYLLAASVSQPATASSPGALTVSPAAQVLADASSTAASPDPGAGLKAPGEPRTAERRQMTVLSCELIGLVALSAELDLEDLREVTAACHRRCTEIIERHRGRVARYAGDAVLAYFGYAQAHEYDAERAVQAGLALVEALPKLRGGTASPLAARVGIATGVVVLGDLDAAGSGPEQFVVGKTPNLAAGLQALAKTGAVVISSGTRSLTGGLFDYRDLGSVAVKGLAELVPAWQVLGASGTESRFEALRTPTTPLVGRGEEIDLLLRRWGQAKAAKARRAVVGRAGHRQIAHRRDGPRTAERRAASSRALLLFAAPSGQCAAPGHPAARTGGRIEARRHGRTALEKLETALAQTTSDLGTAVPLLADLLSIPTGGRYPAPALTPYKRKEKTLQALVASIADFAAHRPLLILCEDVHWSDPTTRELLDLLVDRVATLRALMIIIFRPEFAPRWVGRPAGRPCSVSAGCHRASAPR